MLELLFVAAVAAGFLYASDRKDKRHAAQVRELCQRVQAPEVAVMQHQIDNSTPGDTLAPLSDEEAAEIEKNRLDILELLEREGVA